MIIISSRRDFWDADSTSYHDAIRDIPNLRDESLGEEVSKENFLHVLDKRIGDNRIGANSRDWENSRRILFLVHGFNSDSDEVLDAYAEIQENIASLVHNGNRLQHYDAIIGYLWPGGNEFYDYHHAVNRAGAVANRCASWLALLAQNGVAVDTFAHSMGLRVVLEGANRNFNAILRNSFHFGSAVDNESIEYDNKYFTASKRCQRLYIFHSKHDRVLNVGYRFVHWDSALGSTGPESIASIMKFSPNVEVINCKHHIRNHGDYKSSYEIYRYIQELVFSERNTSATSTASFAELSPPR